MKVELTDPRLVAAMLQCFFGDGPRYEEIQAERRRPPTDPDEEDDTIPEVPVQVPPFNNRFVPQGLLAKNQTPPPAVVKTESNRAKATDAA